MTRRAGSVALRNIVKRHGALTVLKGVDLDIRPGEFFALLGPSGSGKTTTLRILAGLESHDAGSVILDGRDVTGSEPGERDVAMVFQSYALYPHMSVYDNIAFPLRMVRTPAREVDRAVRESAARVKIEHLLERKPGQLSGGQQQRAALARAIVRKPTLFLLDEPLSNLDAKLRRETRVELRKLQRALDVTALYVTHDQEEAMTIADRLAVFMDGHVVQVGTPEEVFRRPATVDVATFLGSPPMNLLPARLAGHDAVIEGHRVPLASDHGSERDVLLGVQPSRIEIATDGLPAQVDLVEQLGDSVIVDLALGATRVRAKLPERTRLAEGARVHLRFDPADVHLFDPATGMRMDP
ncbi:MAG TPA: ABC transporter ATP-binding protein [Casimicrobiaceae bacterium]|nr:ABC transporter ATP-binding protein [Casimicrobiaceae bacterium]